MTDEHDDGWHNLRDNPDDLPEVGITVEITDGKSITEGYYSKKYNGWCGMEQGTVLGWKLITTTQIPAYLKAQEQP